MLDNLPQNLAYAVALISGFGGLWIYLLVFFSAILENLFPPYPGDTVLFAGVVISGTGAVLWPLILMAGIVGNVAGALMVYWFGYVKGRQYFMRHRGRWIDAAQLTRIEAWFQRHGARIILISRFLTGIRSGIALSAGLGEVPIIRMALYTTISTLLWNGLIVILALTFERNWEAIYHSLKLYNGIVIGALALIAFGWFAHRFFLSRRNGAARKDNGGE